jgi:hypothetical protein
MRTWDGSENDNLHIGRAEILDETERFDPAVYPHIAIAIGHRVRKLVADAGSHGDLLWLATIMLGCCNRIASIVSGSIFANDISAAQKKNNQHTYFFMNDF